ncbi:MAG: hypothetical protein EOO20_28495, partial [Chryseobacterium sp.]
MKDTTPLYDGNAINTYEKAKSFGVYPYLPAQELIKAVQLAQKLGRPILIKGEPGCGKSRLAEAIAIEFHKASFKEYYFEWNIKSTSKAIDGLYQIDYLRRLADANLRSSERINMDIKLESSDNDVNGVPNYLSLGVIGKAFQASQKATSPPVIL